MLDLAPVLIAARARAPLLVMAGYREPGGTHRLELLEALDPAALRGGKGCLAV